MTSKQDTDPLKLAVKQHFAFLADDFGFEKHATPKNKNPFSVWYVNGTSRIVVESINYGMNARVALGRSGPIDTFENYDLLDCVDVCSPNAAMDPPGSWTPRGQWTPRNGPPGVGPREVSDISVETIKLPLENRAILTFLRAKRAFF